MKQVLISALLAVSATCQNQTAVTADSPVRETQATIVGDKLPVDGCGAHLSLTSTSPSTDPSTLTRLPTEATRPLMDEVIQAELAKQPPGTLWMGSKNVTIRYRETTQLATLLCGWGAKQEVKAIELLTIRER